MAMVFQRCDSEGDAAARVVGVTQLLALHRTTPDLNTELRPVPGVWWGYRMGGGCQHQRFLVGIQVEGGGVYVSASTLSE